MKKDELLKTLDNRYETVSAGPERASDGYSFSDLGVIFVFNNDDSVDYIICEKNTTINGINSGMKSEEVFALLGKSDIDEDWYEVPENIIRGEWS